MVYFAICPAIHVITVAMKVIPVLAKPELFRQYKLVHKMEVIERLITNSHENRFIELIKPGSMLAVFTDDPGVDYYILKCISEVKQFKQAILDDLGNN